MPLVTIVRGSRRIAGWLPVTIGAVAAIGLRMAAASELEHKRTSGAAAIERNSDLPKGRKPAGARAAAADRSALATAVAASNTFGFELYARVKAGQNNVVCAPVSASIALAMAWAGARGETRSEMARVLALGATEPGRTHAGVAALFGALNARDGKDGIVLQVADRLWGQKDLPFQADYLQLLSERYQAPLESVDFVGATEQARTAINRWAAKQTRAIAFPRSCVPAT